MLRIVLCCAAALAFAVDAHAQSPYAGEQSREIKSLSSQEAADLLAGKGMGLARAAELNGYPGPMHVLELAAQLGLSAQQKEQTTALFEKMRTRAVELGQQLVAHERTLDALFASKSVTPAALQAALQRIGELHAELRRAHLDAHLEQTALLSATQIAAYSKLRGYDGRGGHTPHRSHH